MTKTPEAELPSDRSFGLLVGGILACIGGFLHFRSDGQSLANAVLTALGTVLMLTGLLAPTRLRTLNRWWHRLGIVAARIVNPVVLTLMYAATILPTALIMRALRRDPLHLKFDRKAASYWIERTPPGPAQGSMRDQF